MTTCGCPSHQKTKRRKWEAGERCRDCGRTRSTTVVVFWVNAMEYRVCADCIKAYRGVILK